MILQKKKKKQKKKSKKLHYPLGPLESEAMAMEEGITFAWDVGVRDVVFECDSKTVFGALNGSNEAPATIANVIYGIRHRFKNFGQVLVTHIKRQDNHPTHLLTPHTKNIGNYIT